MEGETGLNMLPRKGIVATEVSLAERLRTSNIRPLALLGWRLHHLARIQDNILHTITRAKKPDDRLIDTAIATAAKVLKEDFPDKRFQLLSTNGSTCEVFTDHEDPSKVYKVGIPLTDISLEFYEDKTSHDYVYRYYLLRDRGGRERDGNHYANEAEKIRILGEKGLGPRLLDFIPSVETSEEARKYRKTKGREHSRLPIIIMERVQFNENGIGTLTVEKLQEEANRLATGLEQLGLFPEDVEYVLDEASGHIMILDAAGVSSKNSLFKTEHDTGRTVYDTIIDDLMKTWKHLHKTVE